MGPRYLVFWSAIFKQPCANRWFGWFCIDCRRIRSSRIWRHWENIGLYVSIPNTWFCTCFCFCHCNNVFSTRFKTKVSQWSFWKATDCFFNIFFTSTWCKRWPKNNGSNYSIVDCRWIPRFRIICGSCMGNIGAAAAIAAGTFLGGWRIVKTMAFRLTQLRPYQGFCAETGGGAILTSMAWLGIPVSTTHAISGGIMGVGATKRLSAVRWGVGKRLIYAWIITIPASAGIAAIMLVIIDRLFGIR